MDDYKLRKLSRIEYYETQVKGWKQRDCTACNGTGYFDDDESPECWSCDGTGKEKYNPKENKDG